MHALLHVSRNTKEIMYATGERGTRIKAFKKIQRDRCGQEAEKRRADDFQIGINKHTRMVPQTVPGGGFIVLSYAQAIPTEEHDVDVRGKEISSVGRLIRCFTCVHVSNGVLT